MIKISFLIVSITFTGMLFSQQTAKDDIKIGVMLNNQAYYDNYYQLKDLGAELIVQRVFSGVNGEKSNFDSLSRFSTIVAVNNEGTADNKNTDWIYYFTNAAYSKWEAEGDVLFKNDPVGLKQSNWVSVTGGAIHSGTDQQNKGKNFFSYGPNYSQYLRYVYTNKLNKNPFINYTARFRMKVSGRAQGNDAVCRLIISAHNTKTHTSSVLSERLVYFSEIDTDYLPVDISYSYQDLKRGDGTPETGFYSDIYKIEYQVQLLGTADLYIDNVEVFDSEIWQKYFGSAGAYAGTVDIIKNYNKQFAPLGKKLKYFLAVDEPHSLDGQEPIRLVQHILDSLKLGRDLLVHFYPGWNNYRDSVDTFEKWVLRAHPAKLMFWYFPYEYDASNDFTLAQYAANLQRAHQLQKNFWATVQAWGYYRKDKDGKYTLPYRYQIVTPAQVEAQAMLALAFGAGAVIYEPYYSYEGWNGDLEESIMVIGVVDIRKDGLFKPRPVFYKIKEIAGRLKGPFGQTLCTLDYTGEYLHMRGESDTNKNSYLEIKPQGNDYHWHAGFFSRNGSPDENYFLFINLKTEGAPGSSELKITNNTKYRNLSISNVENTDPSKSTTAGVNSSAVLNEILAPGEGRLYRTAPVIKYGGRLLYDETTTNGMILKGDMVIENGAVLTIRGTYRAEGNIIVRKGSVRYEANGKIEFAEGKRLK